MSIHLRISVATLLVLLLPSSLLAANANPLDKDPNVNGLVFGLTDAFTNGEFTQDDGAAFNGNQILVQSQNVASSCCHGAGISVPLSNGENGIDMSFDGSTNQDQNDDVPNATPPNSVFATIGNTAVTDPLHGSVAKLENGNILRYSMWMRADPNDPISAAPQIEPVLKFEFWKEALSLNQDTAGGAQPLFGDKVYDTDQHLGEGIWVDLDNSNSVIDASAFAEGRVRTISPDEWTLIEVVHEVDDSNWFGINDDIYGVGDIEEIRAVMFWGHFAGASSLSGSIWIDNVLLEVFSDAAAVTPNPNLNTNPSDDEGDVDLDMDGDIDGDDFKLIQRTDVSLIPDWEPAYGQGFAAGAAVAAVPEPTTVTLIALGLVASTGATRRRR